MGDELIKQWGVPGVIICGLCWFVIWIMKSHKKEREEWRDDAKKTQEDSNKVIRDTGNILSGLKTLLENRNGK